MSYLWTACLLGLASSLHCVGMCGPLVLALPGSSVWGTVLYHFGRLLVYAALGLLAGVLGWGVAGAGWQQPLSLVLGVCLLFMVLAQLPKLKKITRIGSWLNKRMQPAFRRLWPLAQQPYGLLALGALNGLLPCGMVYVALAAALLMPNTMGSMSYMFVFGLGTLPLLVALRMLRRRLPMLHAQRWMQLTTLCVALLLLLRGLNLGIPYISPTMLTSSAQVSAQCH